MRLLDTQGLSASLVKSFEMFVPPDSICASPTYNFGFIFQQNSCGLNHITFIHIHNNVMWAQQYST
jgi:hypothetical protein